MDPATLTFLVVGLLIASLLVLRSVRQVNQWEKGLLFTFGKFTGLASPGLTIVFPGVQRLVKLDTRVRNRDLPQQAVITADNVTAWIDAVIYFKVVDVEKATLNVQDYENAVRDRAKVVLRDVVGETKLDELLSHREEVAAKVRAAVEQFVAQWGLHVELIASPGHQLPKQMQEVIARKAIAERDKQYVIIKSQADLESAKNFAEAARILHSSPGRNGAAAARGVAEPVRCDEQGDLRSGEAVRRFADGGGRGGDGEQRPRRRRQAGRGATGRGGGDRGAGRRRGHGPGPPRERA